MIECSTTKSIILYLPTAADRVLWAGILHLAQPLSWADTLSGFFELSWAEPAQGVLSQIEPAWAGSTQLKDWASLSWEDFELNNWARLSWSCFSLSQLELGRNFINFCEPVNNLAQANSTKLNSWASLSWAESSAQCIEPAWAEFNLKIYDWASLSWISGSAHCIELSSSSWLKLTKAGSILLSWLKEPYSAVHSEVQSAVHSANHSAVYSAVQSAVLLSSFTLLCYSAVSLKKGHSYRGT